MKPVRAAVVAAWLFILLMCLGMLKVGTVPRPFLIVDAGGR